MKKRIYTSIFILIVLCLTINLTCCTSSLVEDKHNTYSKDELIKIIQENQIIKDNAHIMATSARVLGWTDDDKLIKEIQDKWIHADEEQKIFQAELDLILIKEVEEARKAEEKRLAEEKAAKEAAEKARQAEEAKWNSYEAEYATAAYIWRYMKALGWNDYVCAGIMGNLMAEVGGQTLNIRHTLSSNGYYGMCQWSRGYSQVWGAGLETQCNFLRDTIKYEIDTYGFNYQKGFNFNSFLNLTDAQQAALAFAKAYERCGSASYGVRQSNALKAYNYFVN